MTFEQIADCWKQQGMDTQSSFSDQLAEAGKRAAQLKKTVFWRDVREVSASVFVAVAFLASAFPQPPLAAVGSIFVALTALGVGAFLLVDRAKQRKKTAVTGSEPRKELEKSLEAVDHQIWLLKNVGWWYLGPLALGLLVWVILVGTAAPVSIWIFVGAFVLIVTPIFLFFYWLNQKAIKTSLALQREDILRLIAQWDEVEKS